MRKQIDNLLEMLVIKNDIRLDQKELKLQLSSHPTYPSLHALTGVLDHFGVSNLALQLPIETEVLQQLPPCFMAQISEDNVKSLVLIEKQKKQLKITREDNKTERFKEEAFLQRWDGIVLIIEKNEKVREAVPAVLTKVHRWSLILIAILGLGYLAYTLSSSFAQIHFLGSIIGLFLSVLIVRHELGIQSSVVNSFCNLSAATSCDAVLSSQGASVFGGYQLSDISMVTFATQLLFWFFYSAFGLSNFSALVLFTLLAIPITAYSVYYQYQIVEKWCPLCLGIVAVLWIQAGALFSINFSILQWANHEFSTAALLVCALVVSGGWNLLKSSWERKMELEKLEVDHYKFKHNFSVFDALHRSGKSIKPPIVPIAGEIILGNKNAPLEIVLITSPRCGFCRKVHHDLEYLLQQAGDQIRVHIRFHIGSLEILDMAYEISMRLLQIYNEAGEEAGRQALHEVYDDKANHEQWLKNNESPTKVDYSHILQTQYKWSTANGVNFTPDLYIAGKQVPLEYRCRDLIYFIDDIIAQQQEDMAININQMLLPEDIFREK